MTSPNISTYSDCVAALRTSLSFLESSVSILDTGVADLPRLMNVLKTVRHYELIPQSTLAAAETSLRDEIAPAIEDLLARAERQLDRRARRADTLRARSELQQGRLATTTSSSSTTTAGSGVPPAAAAALAGEARLRALAVRQKRETLKYSVETLELEVLQKERELRKRLDGM